MNIQAKSRNYRNDSILVGFSDLKKLKTERLLVFPGEDRAGAAGSLKVGSVSNAVYEAGLENGAIVRPLAGCVDMAPPLIITEAETDELGRRLRAALDRALADKPKG